jgi:signal recognition particle receptor subunit beta
MEEEEIDLDTGTRRLIREEPPPPQQKTMSSSKYNGRTATMLRERMSPYLPPPVVRAMGQVDPLLEPYIGPEASITLFTSLLVCVVLVPLVQSLLGGLSRGGKAIADDADDQADTIATSDYGDTVILCGPMWAGKTRIFYHLCQGPTQAHVPTMMSLRANAALLTTTSSGSNDNNSNNNHKKPLRVLDYPGHSGLQDSLFRELLQSSLASNEKHLRIVLVVDATQPLTAAADFLYDLLQYATHFFSDNGKQKQQEQLPIFVACHKRDLSSSKNPRRIKIMLRTELEKLIQVRRLTQSNVTEAGDADDGGNVWWKQCSESSLDLDQLPHAKLRFEATTCSVGDGIDALVEFCKHGTMQSSS